MVSEFFLIVMQRAKTYDVGNGIEFSNTGFREIFDWGAPLKEMAVDVVVSFIQMWQDKKLSLQYDFLPASFITALNGEYSKFIVSPEKDKFFFSSMA